MSWIWPEYVNRELPLTTRQRKAIHRDAWRLWWANKWNVALYLALLALYSVVVSFAGDIGGGIALFLGAGGPAHKLCRAAANIVLFIACFVLGGALLQRVRFAPCVYRATRRRGYEVCVRCGYWLKGLGVDVKKCPECGGQREPMVNSGPDEPPEQPSD